MTDGHDIAGIPMRLVRVTSEAQDGDALFEETR